MNNHTRKITLFVLLLSLTGLACSLTARTARNDAPNDAPLVNRAALADMQAQPGPPPLASPTPTLTPAVCQVTAHALTLRAGPGADALALDYLTRGQTVTILAADSTWWLISTPSGLTGYVNSKFCERK